MHLSFRSGFLQTRVGRRYLALFLAAALIPVGGLATVSYLQLRSELDEQTALRLERLGKSVGLATLSALTRVNQSISRVDLDSAPHSPGGDDVVVVARFDTAFGAPRSIDRREAARPLSDDEIVHLRRGKSLLTAVTPEREARILVARAVEPAQLSRGIVWVRLNAASLWETVDELVGGEQSHYCVFESLTRQRLRCSPDLPPSGEKAALAAAFGRAGVAESPSTFVTSVRDMYLRYEFGAPEWRIVVLEPAGRIATALRGFTTNYLVTVVGTLALAFLVTHVQIRRSTLPLERLRDATHRVAMGDLQARVAVDSDDEFGTLAAAFNGMAGALERQIMLMRTMDAIDRSVLASRDAVGPIDDAASELSHALPDARVVLARLADAESQQFDVTYIDRHSGTRKGARVALTPEERDELRREARDFVLRSDGDARSYLPSLLFGIPDEQILVLPLVHDGELVGILALGYTRAIERWTSERDRARRLADRVALALANLRLVHRLDALSTGTLTAFARAIDANSPWTAGHSERVTRVALEVGRRLRLTDTEMDTLHRGGLLHDIGKIGVSPAILDKPGPLDDDEWACMRMHPTLGAQILAPLPVLADAIPIVLHHHERFDGTGYPARFAGEAIPKLARVLAVADTFDALVSQRPYRASMSLEETMAYIRSGGGSHFDPKVVDAMLTAFREGSISVTMASSAQAALATAVERVRLPLGRVA